MKKIITSLLILSSYCLYGQLDTDYTNKNSFQIGISRINYEWIYVNLEDSTITSTPYATNSFSVFYNRKMNYFIDYSFGYTIHPLHTFSIGNQIHILQFAYKKPSKIDIYIPITFDFCLNTKPKTTFQIHAYTYGIGMSYPTKKHLEFSLEYKVTQSNIYNYKPYLQFSISYNWGKSQKE